MNYEMIELSAFVMVLNLLWRAELTIGIFFLFEKIMIKIIALFLFFSELISIYIFKRGLIESIDKLELNNEMINQCVRK